MSRILKKSRPGLMFMLPEYAGLKDESGFIFDVGLAELLDILARGRRNLGPNYMGAQLARNVRVEFADGNVEFRPGNKDLGIFFHHKHGFHFLHDDGRSRAAAFAVERPPARRPVTMQFQEDSFFHPWSFHPLETAASVVRRFCRVEGRFGGLVWVAIPDDDHFERKDNWKRYEQLLIDASKAPGKSGKGSESSGLNRSPKIRKKK
ncbi:MAG: hypothetical protein AAF456_12265 [Planctomycetota bacterium]